MLSDKIKQAESSEHANQSSGKWFKFQEGDNTIRILTEPETIYEDYKNGICYTDCGFKGSPKGLAFIHDLKDGQVKLFKMPWKLVKQLAVWESDEEYAFSAYPMPFNIRINAVNAGTKEVEYTFTAGRSNTDVPQEILQELSKKKPIAEIVETLKERNIEKHRSNPPMPAQQEQPIPVIEYPDGSAEGINPDDIPF